MTGQTPSICRLVQYNDNEYPRSSGTRPVPGGTINPGDLDDSEADNWCAALIVHVHSDMRVNLVVWDEYGNQTARTSVGMGEGRHQWRWPPQV